jgi:hypothetical protein
VVELGELVLMISNPAYGIQKLNKRQNVVKEGSAKMVAQFRIGVVGYFG